MGVALSLNSGVSDRARLCRYTEDAKRGPRTKCIGRCVSGRQLVENVKMSRAKMSNPAESDDNTSSAEWNCK